MASDLHPQPASRSSISVKRKRLRYDTLIFLLALLIALPASAIAEILLWTSNYSGELKWTVTLFLGLGWLIGASMLQGHVIRPLQTLSNMVASIREDDFSFRVRGASREDS